MSDDDLEQRLRALQPAALAPERMRELLAAEPPAPGKVRRVWFAIPLSAAAALALAFFVNREPTAPPPIASVANPADVRVFLPIDRTSTLLEVRDVALVDHDPARPYRLVRTTWLDDTTYAGDDGKSTLRRREPRTEIIPVALEIF